MKTYKILIIEDDPVIQGEMETLLRGNGYTAVSVKDFSKVTDTFKAEEPHLILLDIKLPNESGFSICSKIRSVSNVPIIFVTSCNTDMDELNSIMLGGDAFITKPYNTAILLAKIAALLRRVYASEQSEILTWNDATLSSGAVSAAIIPPSGTPGNAKKTVRSPAATMRGAALRIFRKRQCWQAPCSAGIHQARTRNGIWIMQDM